ncbi:MAG: GNAT family N-acetyltransferase [Chloroflexi bacterium]|nr:GNAT family N-acetyltransferase [Chloroflexota bacterium]
MRHEAPLNANLTDELLDLWLPIFDGAIDLTREALLGEEVPHSRITVYTRRLNGRLAGACLLASSHATPSIGGLGEVATTPAARRTGIATELTQQALDDFEARGGQALFLGTVNPAAARIYHRLGWRKLAGARLMLKVSSGASPEEWFVDYFRALRTASVEVRAPTPADRAPMIPLLVVPHDWHALDANTDIQSTRYAIQDSCLGLYRRYAATDGRGAWFVASADGGHVVGLSTVRMADTGDCRVDGFTHRDHIAHWQALIQAAVDWASSQTAARVYANVAVEDEEKRGMFEALGFRARHYGGNFQLGEQVLELV